MIIGASVAPAPAEAGKIGRVLTKSAIVSVARSGRRDGRDDGESDTGGTAKKVDPDQRAAQAKARLEAERAEATPPPSVAAMSAPVGPPTGIVCLAGC